MADRPSYDKTALGDAARSHCAYPPQKADVDLFPKQLTLHCASLEIHSPTGRIRDTRVLIDGTPARGIYSLKINFNTQRETKIELGVFLEDFQFDVKPKETKKGEK